jgi:hypothetical protein
VDGGPWLGRLRHGLLVADELGGGPAGGADRSDRTGGGLADELAGGAADGAQDAEQRARSRWPATVTASRLAAAMPPSTMVNTDMQMTSRGHPVAPDLSRKTPRRRCWLGLAAPGRQPGGCSPRSRSCPADVLAQQSGALPARTPRHPGAQPSRQILGAACRATQADALPGRAGGCQADRHDRAGRHPRCRQGQGAA